MAWREWHPQLSQAGHSTTLGPQGLLGRLVQRVDWGGHTVQSCSVLPVPEDCALAAGLLFCRHSCGLGLGPGSPAVPVSWDLGFLGWEGAAWGSPFSAVTRPGLQSPADAPLT